jgi:hypothetical protein
MTVQETLKYLESADVDLSKRIKTIDRRLREWAKRTGQPGVPKGMVREIVRQELQDLFASMEALP